MSWGLHVRCCLGFLLLSFGFATGLLAQESERGAIPKYQTSPKYYDFLPQAFADVPDFLRRADPRQNARSYLEILLWSGVLIHYDQDLLIGSQQLARRWHLISDDESGTRSRLVYRTKVGEVDVDLRLPRGVNSTFYFIGDGLSTLAVVAGLASYGAYTDDKRALNTASQVMESTVLTGIFVITSKYSFGRQSPNQRTVDGGLWRPMPAPLTYLRNVSSYDAFPSGHVATAMSTLTIVAENYLDRTWIKPVGYSAIGLLMFAMMNNGVHWAGDYPLGLAIGYTAAQTVLAKRLPKAPEAAEERVQFSPFASADGLGILADIKLSSFSH